MLRLKLQDWNFANLAKIEFHPQKYDPIFIVKQSVMIATLNSEFSSF